MRDSQFNEFADGSQLGAEFLDQCVYTFAGHSGDTDAVWEQLGIFGEQAVAAEFVHFVEDHDGRFSVGADFFQDVVDGHDLFVGLRMAQIDDVQQQLSLNDFFEGCFEGFDETVGEFADEPYGVGQEDVLVCGQTEATRCGVERGEEFVFC